MKRNLLALTVLLALAVLTFVQFRFLIIGLRLEKQRFDQRATVAQRNIRHALNEEMPLSDALVTFLKKDEEIKEDPLTLADSLTVFLKSELAKVNIHAQFSFVLTSRHGQEVELSSRNFKAAEFTFGEYAILLGDFFTSQIFREKVLHIDIENLFGYLMSELDYLVIPSVLCLFAILVCLALLINILTKEQKLNEIKNDFINNLTHELKTPAFSISLSNKMAKESLKNGDLDKVTQFLDLIEKENNKLKGHTEKVLELASLENSKQPMQRKKANLHKLINEVIADFTPSVTGKKGQLISRLQAENFEFKVDHIHFKNLVFNLLDNALKYSPTKPLIEIVTINEESYFLLSVKDRGRGISPTDQKLVFNKFYRGSSGSLKQVKGFGLGLSYVKQVVKAHGGKVEVESKLGESTEFKVYLLMKNS